jgi:hypothetical protein
LATIFLCAKEKWNHLFDFFLKNISHVVPDFLVVDDEDFMSKIVTLSYLAVFLSENKANHKDDYFLQSQKINFN